MSAFLTSMQSISVCHMQVTLSFVSYMYVHCICTALVSTSADFTPASCMLLCLVEPQQGELLTG